MSASDVMSRASSVRVALMRGFELRVEDRLVVVPQNAQRVIAFLALRDRPQLRTTVSSSLWMDTTDDRASANLRTALWKLHGLRDRLVHGFGRYLEVAPDVSVDVTELVGRARRLLSITVHDGDADLDAEVGELDADLLPDWDDDWVLFERERLRQLRVHAMEALCRGLSAAGRHGEAVDAGLSAVAAEPLRESGQRVLIEAHLAEGNLSEARRQFELYRSLLWEQLGLFPSVSLCSLVGVMSPGSSGSG